jgi:hypothetical protein
MVGIKEELRMARLEWTVVAQSYVVDRESNSLSILNVLDELNIPNEVPDPPPGQQIAVGPAFSVIQMWSRTNSGIPERISGRFQLLRPDGTVVAGVEFFVDLASADRARSMINLPFFPFSGIGNYRMTVDLKVGDDWQKLTEQVLAVKRVETRPPDAPPT